MKRSVAPAPPIGLGSHIDASRAEYIGPRNAEAVTGQPWRWCRDHARLWGVPILRADAKPLIPAGEFFRALERHSSVEHAGSPDSTPDAEELDAVTELEAMRVRVRNAATKGPL